MPRVLTEAHQWIVASNIDATPKQAAYAVRRQNVYIEPMRVDVLQVTCAMCRKPYEQVADEPCSAFLDNRHLIGGRPDGSRNRLKPTGTDGIDSTEDEDDDDDDGLIGMLV